jgi:CRP-like cAMP-binding protein
MSVALNPPLSIWVQLANFFFLCSGLNGDLLVIRASLFAGYAMIFVNGVLGGPLWPDAANLGHLSVDGMVWAILGMYVHGSSLVCLLLDERRVELGDDEAALWRLLYRTGGMSQRLFENDVLPYLEVVRLCAGDPINTSGYFYIVYQGRVRLRVLGPDGSVHEDRTKGAGEMFDFKHMDLLQSGSVFLENHICCKAESSPVVLFRFRKEDMKQIANRRCSKSMWQALLINNLSNLVEQFIENEAGVNGEYEFDQEGACKRGDRMFGPLQDFELPPPDVAGSGAALSRPLVHLWRSWQRAVNLPWPLGHHPTGIRQMQLAAPPPFPEGSGRGRFSVWWPSRRKAAQPSSKHLPARSSANTDMEDSQNRSVETFVQLSGTTACSVEPIDSNV